MPNSHGRFLWYELITTDAPRAKAFYANVMGWSARDASTTAMPYTLFTVGDAPVGGLVSLQEHTGRASAPPHWIGYVGVDDVDVAAARSRELGGTVQVPPTDVSNISRFAVIADPQMATLALIKGLQAEPEKPVELGQAWRVGWHELLASDWNKAFAFYSKLFGWQKADAHVGAMGTYQQFSVAGEAIGGMFTKPEALPLPFWLFYFNIEDIAAAAKRVAAAGGQVLYGPTDVPGGACIVHCTDPQGAIFALLDRRSRKVVGYFKSAAGPSSSGKRSRRWLR